jgi:hypothetical protein
VTRPPRSVVVIGIIAALVYVATLAGWGWLA